MTKEEALRLLKTQRIDGDDLHEAFDMAIKALEERKTGKWIRPKRSLWHLANCSICGEVSTDVGNYCPNCGAKMEGAEG